jgi:hypothetical protein
LRAESDKESGAAGADATVGDGCEAGSAARADGADGAEAETDAEKGVASN